MIESLHNENAIREYLLGRITDESELEQFEDLLFGDEEFCDLVEVAEDSLINDYVANRLDPEDRAAFEKSLAANHDRRNRVSLTRAIAAVANTQPEPTFWESVRAFLARPAFVGTAALLIVAVFFGLWFMRRGAGDELAELANVYRTERPVESRLSDFGYAPWATTRGEASDREKNRLRIIENELLIRIGSEPDSASVRHALGVFYLTQRRFDEAIAELGRSVELDARNAGYLNDLASAYLEKGRAEKPEARLGSLGHAYDAVNRALAIAPENLPARFNLALCLQEMKLTDQARTAWEDYLRRDPSSSWAGEARSNLEKLAGAAPVSRTKEEVLSDVLAAYRSGDRDRLVRIERETRELASGMWVPDQLTRRIAAARSTGDRASAEEALNALSMIGDAELAATSDTMISDLARFYRGDENSAAAAPKAEFAAALEALNSKETDRSLRMFQSSAARFDVIGDAPDALIARYWHAQLLTDAGRLSESDALLAGIRAECDRRGYRWLGIAVLEWQSNNGTLRNEISKTLNQSEEVMRLADAISDTALKAKASIRLSQIYRGLGDTDRALAYVGPLALAENSYHRSEIGRWRSALYASSAFNQAGLPRAAELFGEEALRVAGAGFLRNSQAVDDSIRVVMQAKRALGNFPESLRFAAESRRIAEETSDETLRRRLVQYSALEEAEIKREAGRFDEALMAYDRAIALFAANTEIAIDDIELQKGRLLCLLALGKSDELEEQFTKTFAIAERYRTLIVDPEDRNRFFDGLQFIYDARIETEMLRGDERAAFGFAELSRARTLLDFVNDGVSISDAEKRFPDVAQPMELTAIQAQMPAGTDLVVYSVLENRTIAWVISRDGFGAVNIGSGKAEIARVADRLRAVAGIPRSGGPDFEQASDEAFRMIVAPVAGLIRPGSTLAIVPDKSLFRLPFTALRDAVRGRFLIEDRAVILAPSASVFVKRSETAKINRALPESLLAVGNPAFDRTANQRLADLPDAEDEARTVSSLFEGGTVMLGSEATAEALLKRLSSTGVLHFAGHYVPNDDSESNSRLVMANGDLDLAAIARTRMPRAKLVVLSACETGTGRIFEGEGVAGAAQAFLAIGAPTVVASGWRVESASAKRLMIAFHQHRIKDGVSVAEALRRAQISMIHESPYLWAAFSVVGGIAA